jgi:hypothetical protein
MDLQPDKGESYTCIELNIGNRRDRSDFAQSEQDYAGEQEPHTAVYDPRRSSTLDRLALRGAQLATIGGERVVPWTLA